MAQPQAELMAELQLAAPLAEICRQAGEEAKGLMLSGGLYCAPAVLAVLNRRLGGGLDDDLVRRLTAGLPEGMGSGCTCGALSGAQVALGLFLGGRGFDRAMAASARALHDAFKAAHGSTCCRVLTRKAKGRREKKEHCAALTGHAAELACRLALKARPELAGQGQDSAAPMTAPAPWWRRLKLG
jgi:C_GCAxxG_C_C family probable redox protein